MIIDLTNPVAGNVFDGTTSDISYTGSDTSLTITWSGFSDSRSGIGSYILSIQDELDNNILGLCGLDSFNFNDGSTSILSNPNFINILYK